MKSDVLEQLPSKQRQMVGTYVNIVEVKKVSIASMYYVGSTLNVTKLERFVNAAWCFSR